MSEPNGVGVPAIQIVISFLPTTGQIQVQWPQIDDIGKLGLIEMAKVALLEERRQRANSEPSRLIVPVGRLAS